MLPPPPTATLADVIHRLPEATEDGAVACFDADGTLWPGDVQETILRELIEERRLLGVDYGRDVFFHEYQQVLDRDPPAGILRAMTLFEGLHADEVDRAARAIVEREFAPKLYAEMTYFVGAVRDLGYEPWIVSATAERFVRLVAPLAGIEERCVIGLRTAVDADGRFTGTAEGPIPYGAGKVSAIDARIARRPALVAGNGRGDLEMLETALTVAVAVNPDPQLYAAAQARGWPIVEVRRPEVRMLVVG